MKRGGLALLLGAFITVLPWMLRPLLGDKIAVLWLPGFLASSHWYPLGLHGPDANTAKAMGCGLNVLVWAGAFLAISYCMQLGRETEPEP